MESNYQNLNPLFPIAPLLLVKRRIFATARMIAIQPILKVGQEHQLDDYLPVDSNET
jgi:hydroxyacyl-ACP dehydratase HTD2-like protein with hotdog domain